MQGRTIQQQHCAGVSSTGDHEHGVQADQDLYADFGLDSGELPSRQPSLHAAGADEAAPEAPADTPVATEAPAQAPSPANDEGLKQEPPAVEAAPLDTGLSAEGALQAIANALQLDASRRSPAQIAAAAQVQIQQADSAKHLLEEERKKQLAYQIQVRPAYMPYAPFKG